MDIREQIEWLTGYAEALHHRDRMPHESITNVRDTMKRLNAVYEAAIKAELVLRFIEGNHRNMDEAIVNLRAAIDAVQIRQVLPAPVESKNFTREEAKAAVKAVKKP